MRRFWTEIDDYRASADPHNLDQPDGGILNNLPADVLVRQGCNCLIGVDVSANIEHRVGDNIPDSRTEQMKTPGVLATLLRCFNVQANNMSRVGAQRADVTIAPNVCTFKSSAFTQTPEMADIGYRTTMETLPQIREFLQNLDGVQASHLRRAAGTAAPHTVSVAEEVVRSDGRVQWWPDPQNPSALSEGRITSPTVS